MHGAIHVAGLGKRFTLYERERPRTIKGHFLQGLARKPARDTFWALQDVNFQVRPGRMLGIIGHNGSGKSTLMRLIGGVMKPDAGKVEVQGRVSGLLALNTGMHAELTGRQNIMIGGIIAGLTRQQVLDRFDDIVDFAELSEFINSPVRTYSTGMLMRLGFAVAVHTDPDVLLIDEVLSVGDMAFQSKCVDRIRQFRDKGCAIVLITHDLSQVERLCDDAIWLRRGSVIAQGSPEVLVGDYRAAMALQTREMTPEGLPEVLTSKGVPLRLKENRFGSLEVRITDVRVTNGAGLAIDELRAGDPLSVELSFEGDRSRRPIVVVSVTSSEGVNPLDVNTDADAVSMPADGLGEGIRLDVDRLDLAPGNYFVNVGLFDQTWDFAFDYHWRVYPLKIVDRVQTPGFLSPPRRWHVRSG